MTQIAANRKRELNDLRAKAYMDHRLSELVAFAINDPAKMPKLEEAYPFVKVNMTRQSNHLKKSPIGREIKLFLCNKLNELDSLIKIKEEVNSNGLGRT